MRSALQKFFYTCIFVGMMLSMVGIRPVHAASVNAATANELITAITTANSNGQNDTITLTANIVLTEINNSSPLDGENGLPIILADGGSSLTINGNGNTISRSSAGGTPDFRFFLIATGANLTLQNLTLSNGNCNGCFGGAIENSGTLTLINTTFIGNQATNATGNAYGGAIYNRYIATITDSTFSNNSTSLPGLGGAVVQGGFVMNIHNSTFNGNASSYGGAILNSQSLTISNSTFTDNSAAQDGGAVTNFAGATTTEIINSTFSDNGANRGANLSATSGNIILENTIVAHSFLLLQTNCYGGISIIAGADNLATDVSCGSATPVFSSVLNLDSGLADNGGPTQTIKLLYGSPAIDAGDATICANAPVNGLDQRGITRPFGAGCDVGAYEYDGSTPTVTITPASYNTNEQIALNLHGTGISVNDLDGNPLTVTVEAANIFSELTANVGTTGVVIASGNNTPNLQLTGTIAQLNDFFAGNSGGTLTFLLDDDTPPATVILAIIADDGTYTGSDTATINITSVNDSPVNTVPVAQTLNEDTALVFSSGNSNQISIDDLDVSSNNLEVTFSVTNGVLTLAGTSGLSFTTGDGTADSTMVFSGTLNNINNALATLTFNPTANYNGSAILSITTSDLGNVGTGGVQTDTDTVNITINAVNDPPIVPNPIPNQNATEDIAFSFQFAANTFSDPDIGDVPTYSAQLAGGGAIPAWLNFNAATRTFSGTPANADVGTVTIMVTAEDSGSQTVSDNFDLVVANANDAPTVTNAIPDQNAYENTPFNFQFAFNTFSDPDVGDTLTYSAQLNGGGALPAWLSFDAATRTFSGTPINGDIGVVSIDVIANDGNGGTVTDTFTITVNAANDAPFIFNPIPNQNAAEDTPFTFMFAANTFSDPDIGDTLTYSAQLAGGSLLPAWLNFNAATRTFSGTPTNSDVGTITIEVTAEDSTNQTVSDNFDLVVMNTNDMPTVVNPIPNQNATENNAFNFQFANNTFNDPDIGDTLTYSAQLNGGGALPAWLSFDTATRTFSGTPLSGNVGTVSVDVIANDGNGGSVTDTFNIIVASISNLPPVVANPIPDQNTTEGSAFNFQFAGNTFSDPNLGDILTYSAQLAGGGALPAWLSFDAVTRTFSGTPTSGDVGIASIDVIADDGYGGTVTDTFDITVIGLNPSITSVNVTNPDGTYSIGNTIFVTITFDQTVIVDTTGGTPMILLETGITDRSAPYTSGSGSTTLTFTYTVQSGDSTPDLDYQSTTALALNGGTITSSSSSPAVLTLPTVGGASSIAGQHNIVIDGNAFNVSATSLIPSYTTGPATFTVTFGDDAYDPIGNSDPDDVTNPDNYLLIEDGVNGTFDTTSCLGGLTTDDTQINISSVTYFSRTAVVSLSIIPPVGNYRLFVCGTTSIVDLAGNALAGDEITPGTDYIFNFVVGSTIPGTPNTETENITASNLPKTGFAPKKITTLPPQPANLAYAELGDIWLEIPALNVKTTIIGVPFNNGDWDVSWLGNNTGWLNGTAFPTWTGNSVLTAHVTNADGLTGPFAELNKLKYGDQVIVHMGGAKYIYEIRNSRLARPFATGFAFESLNDHSYLTLITCQVYLPTNETYLFRRVVRAVLVSVENE